MNSHTKLGVDAFGQLARQEQRFVGTRLTQRGHDLGTQLVPPPRTGPLPYERGQATARKRCLSSIESRTGKAERGCRMGDRLALRFDAPHHLVLDLDQVAGIEE